MFKGLVTKLRSTGTVRNTIRNTIRIIGISLALVALLVFAIGVVSDWNHRDSSKDAQCPYCHLAHQTPDQQETASCVAFLTPVACLPLPEDVVPSVVHIFSQTVP